MAKVWIRPLDLSGVGSDLCSDNVSTPIAHKNTYEVSF